MLNVYNKFDKPNELPGKEIYKKMILARGKPSEIRRVTMEFKERWPDAEPFFMKDAYQGYKYALEVIKGRWEEAEPYIMKNKMIAVRYARDVIKSGWQEPEEIMFKDYISCAEQQYKYELEAEEYDLDVEEDVELEEYREYLNDYYKEGGLPLNLKEMLFKHPIALYDYTVYVYQKPWPQASPYLQQMPDVYRRYVANWD